ncbi:tigger transposable element-derived protein 6-like [Galendromus occidentalis]|uniref:Tigger transposable element-derived protein 6-like n=1 Tax=Galendromus occidentalis TaxID=34638 RepID=A0AAJ6VXD5_9ACAR|nr:tigger transposable element-derived protein 6-like [Galendromus occidentalis]
MTFTAEDVQRIVSTAVREALLVLAPKQTASTSGYTIMDHLNSRIPKFTFKPENGHTFEKWYARYAPILESDGGALAMKDNDRNFQQRENEIRIDRGIKDLKFLEAVAIGLPLQYQLIWRTNGTIDTHRDHLSDETKDHLSHEPGPLFTCVIDGNVVESWILRLPDLIGDFSPRDIFNMDGLFSRSLPNKSLVEKGRACRGGKVAKERLSIALCCRPAGEKFPPLVIWKYLNPRCFKGQGIKRSGIFLEANTEAWMTSKIFKTWLSKFNSYIERQNRNVLLILDNAPCHAQRSMSNVKLLFLPPNVTSELQPLDQGVIQSSRIHYRKLLLGWLVSRMDECDGATELPKKINVLGAVRWVSRAWSNVREETIAGCFSRCGIPCRGIVAMTEAAVDDDADVLQLSEQAGLSEPFFVEEIECFGTDYPCPGVESLDPPEADV